MRVDQRRHGVAATPAKLLCVIASCAMILIGTPAFGRAARTQAAENAVVQATRSANSQTPYARREPTGVIDDRNLRVPPKIESAGKDIDLQYRLSEMKVADGPDGLTIAIDTDHGERVLTPREFVTAVRDAQEIQRTRGFLYVLFNITRTWGFVWVGAGFLAQAMFTYRMILQWWASEKHKRSVVPVGYWWGSLFGGMLLFAYFIWRKDIVGYIGQSTGIFIYARNLMLIYRGRRIEAEGARPIGPSERSAADPST